MNVIKIDFYYKSKCTDNDIHACIWKDAGNKSPKGIVQLVHGMVEHIGRYEEFARFLAENGYIVAGSDLPGHGRSVKKKEDFGFFGEGKDSWKNIIEDVRSLFLKMKKDYAELPYYMVAHSMGSFVAREYAYRYKNDLDALVLIGTKGKTPEIAFGMLVANAGIRFKGAREKGFILNKMSFASFCKTYENVKTKLDWLSTDEAAVDSFIRDPLCGFVFSYAGFRDLFKLLLSISSNRWFNGVPKELPILIMSGTEDPVSDYGRGASWVYKRLKEAGVKNVSLKLYSGCRHELLNERNKEEVKIYIINWLKSLKATI